MLNITENGWEQSTKQLLSANHQIEKASLLFDRIEDKQIESQLARLG